MIDSGMFKSKIESASMRAAKDSVRDLNEAANLINETQKISMDPASKFWNGEKRMPDDVVAKYTIKLLGVSIQVTALYTYGVEVAGYSNKPALVKMDFID